MPGFRNLFIKNISAIAGYISTDILQKLSKQDLILPFYHTVSDRQLPHIKNLYRLKSTKQFIEDLDFLLKHYKPIDFLQFDDIIKNRKKLSKPSFLLSFDDGLSEFYHIIAPILIKKGIPAVCFLNDAFIDNKELFYRYKASLLIEESSKYTGLADRYISKSNINDIKTYLLSLSYDNKDLLDKIAKEIEYDFQTYLKTETPYLSTMQIKSLIKDGFYFGSHSYDHPEYRFLDLKKQLQQTLDSTDNICKKFNLDYRIFSFPFTDFGVTKDFFRVIYSKGEIQYSFGSAGQKQDSEINNHQRIPLEMSDLTAKRIINSELIYYIAKRLAGKNTILRK